MVGGEIGTLAFRVPYASNWVEFSSLMKESEKDFGENVLKCTGVYKSKNRLIELTKA